MLTDHSDLRAAALAATPGPWHREMLELAPGYMTIGVGSADTAVCIMHGFLESPRGNRDAAYVAAANPARVLALLDEVDALKAELESVKDAAFERNMGEDL